jgi:hypothetical protein
MGGGSHRLAEQTFGLREIKLELLVQRRSRRYSADPFIRRSNGVVELECRAIFLQRLCPLLLSFERLGSSQLCADHASALLLFDLTQSLGDLRGIWADLRGILERSTRTCMIRIR